LTFKAVGVAGGTDVNRLVSLSAVYREARWNALWPITEPLEGLGTRVLSSPDKVFMPVGIIAACAVKEVL